MTKRERLYRGILEDGISGMLPFRWNRDNVPGNKASSIFIFRERAPRGERKKVQSIIFLRLLNSARKIQIISIFFTFKLSHW